MKRPEYVEVDQRRLRLPPARSSGADPLKLQMQIARFGASIVGMPPPFVYRGSDGEFMIFDGVTRCTRVAKLLPGVSVRVEVVDDLPAPFRKLPSVGDRLS
jgi:hypothetical protein